MFTFAHYWGIDEVGIFVVPALLAILALRWAERKARKKAEAASDEESPDSGPLEESVDVD